MQEIIQQLLVALGEDPTRPGLMDTPRRTAAAWKYLVRNSSPDDAAELLKNAIFEAESNHMVIVRDIEIYSICEHHLLPFFGVCHIGYIPRGRIIGVSKLARMADLFARRLQVQERLTHQIARTLMDTLKPEGVGVIIEARHLCMMMRGVEKQNSRMITSAMLGTIHSSVAARNEFLQLARSHPLS